MSISLTRKFLCACLCAFILAASASPASVLQEKTQTLIETESNSSIQNVISSDASYVELVFVLDTTGSMGGLLEGAKTKIWGIVNDIMQKRHNQSIHVRVGLVAFRDRGDAYLTKVTPLSENLDDVYAELMALRAEGGGDTPEDVRTAMKVALSEIKWSKSTSKVSQIMFLVGDAPPHEDYLEVPSTLTTVKLAQRKGIIVNAIQCGTLSETTAPWRDIAQYGGGEYFAIAQNGGVQVVTTPYDVELAALGEKIGGTYMAYGSSEVRTVSGARMKMMESNVSAAAPMAARAERAINKAINTSAYNDADLLQQVEKGKVNLASIKAAELPEVLQNLKPEERQEKLDQALKGRKILQERIVHLSKQRDQYLQEQSRKNESKQTGFDAAVSAALEKQIK
jgi:Mg-chelatase subunit ChlD